MVVELLNTAVWHTKCTVSVAFHNNSANRWRKCRRHLHELCKKHKAINYIMYTVLQWATTLTNLKIYNTSLGAIMTNYCQAKSTWEDSVHRDHSTMLQYSHKATASRLSTVPVTKTQSAGKKHWRLCLSCHNNTAHKYLTCQHRLLLVHCIVSILHKCIYITIYNTITVRQCEHRTSC